MLLILVPLAIATGMVVARMVFDHELAAKDAHTASMTSAVHIQQAAVAPTPQQAQQHIQTAQVANQVAAIKTAQIANNAKTDLQKQIATASADLVEATKRVLELQLEVWNAHAAVNPEDDGFFTQSVNAEAVLRAQAVDKALKEAQEAQISASAKLQALRLQQKA